MDDAVAVALILCAPFRRRFLVLATARVVAELCVGRENLTLDLFKFLSGAVMLALGLTMLLRPQWLM